MGWFPIGTDSTGQWRLDIVGLLAVTGESFIHDQAEAITSSPLCLLPRLMPAPQALMRARRPPALESEVAKTVGVYSGVVLDTVGFFANIIHPLNELEPFSFHMLDIQHRVDFQNEPFDVAPEARKHIGRSPDDVELAANNGTDDNGPQAPRPGIRRRPTYKEKVSMFISNGPRNAGRSHVSAPSLFAPLHVVGVASFLLTIALMVAAIIWEDGTALMGILLISFSASIIGYASWWQPILMRRSFSAPPPGDIVIRTREGAFLLIKCTETVARELYSGIDECHYRVGPMAYRGYMILGAIFIMPAVVLFGNCTFSMQIMVGVSYMVLNIVYWFIGILPKRYSWDLNRYTVTDITAPDAQNANRMTDESSPEGIRSFTRTLWYVIRETKRTAWVERSGAAPNTPQWRRWLVEAEHAAVLGNRGWQAVSRKDELMKTPM